jgi:hypothetical protein
MHSSAPSTSSSSSTQINSNHRLNSSLAQKPSTSTINCRPSTSKTENVSSLNNHLMESGKQLKDGNDEKRVARNQGM